ncbi:MAG: hypothetical protein IPL65_17730 [Lewinellaceae bacterium]|nr:hypothetical protein [Lewinellaceae bacterium]
MKYLFFAAITCLSFLPVQSFSQYLTFPAANANWCYHGYGDQGQNLGDFCFSPTELVELNGKTYSKISYQPYPYASAEDPLYRSENNGKFYALPQDSTDEILVYDFSLEAVTPF